MGNPKLERKGDGVLTSYILIVGRLTILVSPRLDGMAPGSRTFSFKTGSVLKNLRETGLWHLVPSLHGKYMGRQWKQWLTLFWGVPKSLQMVTAAMKLKDAYSMEGKL